MCNFPYDDDPIPAHVEREDRFEGTLRDRYDIYVANTADDPVLSFDEWLMR